MPINKRLKIAGVFLTILALLLPSQAFPITQEKKLEQQRSDFLVAEKAFENNKHRMYRLLKFSLKSYPLYPYLEYRELSKNFNKTTQAEVTRFLSNYATTPLASRLRNGWLKHLAKKGRWKEYLALYQAGRSHEKQCNYLTALIKTGQQKRAFPQVAPIWLHGKSLPHECDSILDAWIKAKQLTPELVWGRIELAMNTRHTRLAQYLGKFLSTKDKKWLDLWLSIHRKPERVSNLSSFSQHHPQRETILAYGILRLARKSPDQAESTWKQVKAGYFTPEKRKQTHRKLALTLTSIKHPTAMQRLAALPVDDNDTYLHERRIRFALKSQDWDQVFTWINALPETLKNTLQWRYWHARALEKKGFKTKAKRIFQDLASDRSYHGFLAADQLKLRYQLGHKSLQVSADSISRLSNKPAFRRATELYRLDRLRNARREWYWATRDLNLEELQAAAKLAHNLGWHGQAIATVAKAGEWDDLELRFPLAYQQKIERRAKQYHLEPAWVFALLRQESAFMRTARSSVGAMGLMQLMPRTANNMAKRLKQPLHNNQDLYQAETNIQLGTAYLNRLLKQTSSNPILATAAYNAGLSRVRRWMPPASLPADIWIETIPFRETRRYLQRILTYTAIYQQRLKLPVTPLHQRMQPIRTEPTRLSKK